MKNAIAIVLLICFAIFHFGYYAVYFSASISLENRWDDQIYGDQVLQMEERMLEIPLQAPYMANQEEFQATNTSFEKDGKYYRAIKQRYQNDTLQVVYVQDTAKKNLDSAVKRWISALAEDQLPQDQEAKQMGMLFAKDYIPSQETSFDGLARHGFEFKKGFIFSSYFSPYFTIDSPPPQLG
ncbi:MAG: hypothetical protein ACK5BR_01205 [Bacteroidota bacterium]|nr:hypothetical protein [Algoriphagus sp.]